MAYIDTELLKENFAKRLNKHLGIMIGIDDVAIDLGLAIDDTPSADVEEVKYAKWERYGSDWECSNCDVPVNAISPRCPYCGAKMDGGNT